MCPAPHPPPFCPLPPACATVAEVRKRGDEFWSEFEFYLSDLLVGVGDGTFLLGATGDYGWVVWLLMLRLLQWVLAPGLLALVRQPS